MKGKRELSCELFEQLKHRMWAKNQGVLGPETAAGDTREVVCLKHAFMWCPEADTGGVRRYRSTRPAPGGHHSAALPEEGFGFGSCTWDETDPCGYRRSPPRFTQDISFVLHAGCRFWRQPARRSFCLQGGGSADELPMYHRVGSMEEDWTLASTLGLAHGETAALQVRLF